MTVTSHARHWESPAGAAAATGAAVAAPPHCCFSSAMRRAADAAAATETGGGAQRCRSSRCARKERPRHQRWVHPRTALPAQLAAAAATWCLVHPRATAHLAYHRPSVRSPAAAARIPAAQALPREAAAPRAELPGMRQLRGAATAAAAAVGPPNHSPERVVPAPAAAVAIVRPAAFPTCQLAAPDWPSLTSPCAQAGGA